MRECETTLDVSLLMDVIRRDIRAGKNPLNTPEQPADTPLSMTRLTSSNRASKQIFLGDLLAFDDEDFIRHAYTTILQRSPDEDGLRHYLAQLRSGAVSKVEILASLRYSREGRTRAVQMHGLLIRAGAARFFRLPVIGYVAHLAWLVLRLPAVARKIRTLETHWRSEARMRQADWLHTVTPLQSAVRDLEYRLETYRNAVDDLQEKCLRAGEVEAIRDTMNPIPHELYESLESKFRGSRVEVKRKLQCYLPVLDALDPVLRDAPMLDIGCGHGEWLQLLSTDYTAEGIDSNQKMIEACKALNLHVRCGEAVSYLQGLPDDLYGCITGFHIIEHISFSRLAVLIDESFRVLKPGGIVIFETPNPENIAVGTSRFYLDPTHRKPLPPQLTEFLVERAGFDDIEIWRVNNSGDPMPIGDRSDPAIELLRMHYDVAPDYAVIARKPNAAGRTRT